LQSIVINVNTYYANLAINEATRVILDQYLSKLHKN